MRLLITGITGFVGSHLADYLLDNNLGEVYGIKRWRSPLENIEHRLNELNLFDCDLRDLSSLMTVLDEIRPDIIVHLAAQSLVPSSYIAPVDSVMTNTIGTINLLEAIRLLKQDPVIGIGSTSEVYGNVTMEEIPIKETHSLNPISPYAVSKVGEDRAAFMYWKAYGLKTIISRMFTHSGPKRYETFFISSFAKQLVEIELGIRKEKIVYVGNLDSVRTIADVRDAVRAYWLLVNKCDYGEVYNIGGNVSRKVEDILNMLCDLSTVDHVTFAVDLKRLRPADATLQIPDVRKFHDKTGWYPEIPLRKTLEDTLDYWRNKLRRQYEIL